MNRKMAYLFVPLGVISIGIAVTEQPTAKEAPTGFDTPTLSDNPGSQSVSNGIAEPPGDTYVLDQAQFERRHAAGGPVGSLGLGPVYNATACVECHQNVVTGAGSQFTELRAGHIDANGNFANPTIPINGGINMITGRSIVNDRAICEAASEHLPDSENIRTLRAVLSTLGDGFVEAVDDRTLLAIAANQPAQSHGLIHGEAIQISILEAPGHLGVGKFGWKDQQPTVLSFVADAYLMEMGVTSRLRPNEVTRVCEVNNGIEDVADNLGLANIDHFAQFVRGTKAPPRDNALAATLDARAGHDLFILIGCGTCHVETLTTAPAGTLINGGTYRVPDAIGNKIFHPFGDFLLHDVGTGDGIVQAGPQDTANKLRTAPLWGLHIRSRFMHDLGSLTLDDAILRHKSEAQGVTSLYNTLPRGQQQQLITFLKSL
jgi:CxxC motif-containing protein (DUF1111 family)